MSTLRGWWEEEPETRQYFWSEILRRDGTAPAECSGSICRTILEQNLAAASMWCILPLQDWLGIDEKLRHPVAADERINVPANPNHYWRYCMHLTIEELLRAHAFNRVIAELVEAAGRNQAHGKPPKADSLAALSTG
jgi:4-alpha-glucanotransferase